ncbi:MAG: SLBB domain-containing protein [Actinobacteria bacterium]|nr:SLBB domain-containing protein [Actinomycetota bacterium]
MSQAEIESIKNAGIVGAGGAGFPSHVKFDAKVDTLIVNAAECEPLIHVDKILLQKYFSKVYEGMKTAAGLVGAGRVVLALKEKYKEAISAIEAFKKSLAADGSALDFEIFKIGNFYPAGDEQVLVNEVTGRVVPEGGIPLMVGVVVTNVETLYNVTEALAGRPVTKKFVTVNGEVSQPSTFEVPVGTPVSLLLECCGGIKISEYEVLDGGPMMGKLIDRSTYAVKKTTKSIIVLPRTSIVIEQKLRSIKNQVKRAQAICLSCRMCTDLCPRYLLGHDLFPDEMMKKMYKGELRDDELEKFDFAFLCCDCGLCELYSCVVDLSARSLFNYIKAELAKKGIKNPHTRKDVIPNEFREFRKVPVGRLEKRLEIDKYDSRALLADFTADVNEVKIYLLQHVGAPSEPVVALGEAVISGQLIAKIPDGKLGANIHSSINGRVADINKDYIIIKKN